MANDPLNNRVIEAAICWFKARSAFCDNNSGFSLNPPQTEKNKELLSECSNAECALADAIKEMING